MVDCDESDKMMKISGKMDKSDTYKEGGLGGKPT